MQWPNKTVMSKTSFWAVMQSCSVASQDSDSFVSSAVVVEHRIKPVKHVKIAESHVWLAEKNINDVATINTLRSEYSILLDIIVLASTETAHGARNWIGDR